MSTEENKKPELEVIKVAVKKWVSGIKYPCPKCQQPISPNSEGQWICTPCNVRIKAVMNF